MSENKDTQKILLESNDGAHFEIGTLSTINSSPLSTLASSSTSVALDKNYDESLAD